MENYKNRSLQINDYIFNKSKVDGYCDEGNVKNIKKLELENNKIYEKNETKQLKSVLPSKSKVLDDKCNDGNFSFLQLQLNRINKILANNDNKNININLFLNDLDQYEEMFKDYKKCDSFKEIKVLREKLQNKKTELQLSPIKIKTKNGPKLYKGVIIKDLPPKIIQNINEEFDLKINEKNVIWVYNWISKDCYDNQGNIKDGSCRRRYEMLKDFKTKMGQIWDDLFLDYDNNEDTEKIKQNVKKFGYTYLISSSTPGFINIGYLDNNEFIRISFDVNRYDSFKNLKKDFDKYSLYCFNEDKDKKILSDLEFYLINIEDIGDNEIKLIDKIKFELAKIKNKPKCVEIKGKIDEINKKRQNNLDKNDITCFDKDKDKQILKGLQIYIDNNIEDIDDSDKEIIHNIEIKLKKDNPKCKDIADKINSIKNKLGEKDISKPLKIKND